MIILSFFYYIIASRIHVTRKHRILESLFPLLVEDVLESRHAKDQEKYDEALKALPEDYRDSWTVLARDAAQFILMLANLERGREAIVGITKNDYKKFETRGKKYFQKVNDLLYIIE